MIFDLSPPISANLGVWPGDTPPSREVVCDMKQGANVTLSTLHATAHLGAHADGPNHYGVDAHSIDRQSLETYLGPCQVIHVKVERGARFTVADIAGEIRAPRVLFRTGTFPDPNAFNEDFAAPAPALIEHLAGKGVKLIGVDTPSVDLFDSKDLPSHKMCLKHDVAILEGLVLAHGQIRERGQNAATGAEAGVPEGVYELIALPLRLVGFDASPVRAILRTLPD